MNTTIHIVEQSYIKGNTYINIDKEVNHKKPQFKAGDHVRISK